MDNNSIKNFKKSNVTSEEKGIRDQIEAYHKAQQELSEQIEKERKDGKDVSILENTFEKNKKEWKKLSASLEKFEISEN